MPTLKDIAAVLVQKHQLEQQEAEAFLNAVSETILDGLKKDRLVKLKGFGTFKLTSVKDRESISVQSGERVLISGHDKITFTPDAVMRDLVNKPFAQFETVDLADGVNFDDVPDVELEEEVAKISESTVYSEDEPLIGLKEKNVEMSIPEPVVLPVVEPVKEPITETAEEQSPETVEEPVVEEQPIVQEQVQEPEEKIESVQESVEKVETVMNAAEPSEEPAKICEPATGNETVAEESASLVDEPNEDAEAEVKQEDSDEEYSYYDDDDEMSECKKVFILYAVIINVIIAALFFVLGYFAHAKNVFGIEKENATQNDSLIKAAKAEVARTSTVAPVKTDSQKVQNAESPKEQPKAEPAGNNEVDPSKYDKDARVRLGAYRIVGTASTITVKSGQTIKSISTQYMGPGMECYLEAYNDGITSVEKGQKLKIPKLELKKKSRKSKK